MGNQGRLGMTVIKWILVLFSLNVALFFGFWLGCVDTYRRVNEQLSRIGVSITAKNTVVVKAEKFKRPKQSMLRPTPGSYRRVKIGAYDPTIAQMQEILAVMSSPKPGPRVWKKFSAVNLVAGRSQ